MRLIQHCLQLLALHKDPQLQETVDANVVVRGNLQVNQGAQFLRRKCMRLLQHGELNQGISKGLYRSIENQNARRR